MIVSHGCVFILILLLFFNIFFFFFTFIFILAVLGLHCCVGFSLVAASGGYSLVVVRRLLVAVASLVVEHVL